ncbi:MAG: STAS domain-containing protein [Armatimonadetes bacterium]|nr:STAS domain-containing protein [Armatimonadota bacterium]
MAETWHVSKLDVDIHYIDDIPIIEAKGECDLITSKKLKEAADNLLETGRNKIIFDLRNMVYIDSAGFRILLDTKNRATEKGGDIVLVSLTEPVDRAFKLLRLDELIIRAETIEEAINHLKSIA